VLLDAGEGTKLATAEIDLSRITDVRARVPALKHRRSIDQVTVQ